MSFIDNNLKKIKIGFDGEQDVRDWLVKQNIPFMQVDIMFKHKGVWCLGEIKTQEKFLAPPFDGHGLPKWQIDRRLEFEKDTGIIAYLFVKDINDNCLYIQTLNNLLNGEYIQTNGKKPRVIFNLKNFKRFELD